MPSKSIKQWLENTLAPAVEKFKERQQKFHTDSGITIEPLYGPEDLTAQDQDYHRDLGYPGEYPWNWASNCLAIIRRCISEVPSYIVVARESLKIRSTGESRK